MKLMFNVTYYIIIVILKRFINDDSWRVRYALIKKSDEVIILHYLAFSNNR
jgi:hypothetical protein